MATSVVKVNILGDAQDLRRAFGDAERASRSFGDRVQDDLRSLGGLAVNAAKVIAGIGLAVVGLTLKGGLDRALNLEDARAKLQGLGHDTETIETIMQSALDGVRDTAFGLDEAAGVAATAIAAGIEPGEELTRIIGLTGDAAGFMAGDFDRSGRIVNKILASNRLSMEEVNQLHDAGIGILSMLADEYGVTADAMRDMVSDGEIDAAKFVDVLENNIGGTALEMGETTRGSLANVGAAFSRLGATVVEEFLPLARGVFQGVIEGVDNMTSKVGPAMDAFANSDFFATLEEHVRRIPEYMESAATALIDFWEATELVRDNVGTAIKGLVTIIESEMGKAVIAVGGLKLALDALKKHPLIGLAAAVGLAVGKIKEHVESLAEPVERVQERFDDLNEAARIRVLRDALSEMGLDLVDLENFLADSGTSIDEFAGTTEGAADLIEIAGSDIGKTWEEVDRQIDGHSQRAQKRLEELGPAFEGSGSSAGEFEAKFREAAEGAGESADQVGDDLEGMADKAEEVFDQVEGDVDDFIDGFSEIPEETDISLQEWIDNMNARNEEIEAWFNNLNFLRANGMREFVEEMEKAGPEAASGLVQEAVDAINDGDTGLPHLANQAAKGAEEVGDRVARGAAQGVDAGAHWLNQSVEAMVRGALARAKKVAHVESPSRLFAEELGEPIAEGVAEGIKGSDAPARAISDKIGRMAAMPVNGHGSNGAGGINITVHAGLGTNGHDVGEQIVEEIVRARRRGIDV